MLGQVPDHSGVVQQLLQVAPLRPVPHRRGRVGRACWNAEPIGRRSQLVLRHLQHPSRSPAAAKLRTRSTRGIPGPRSAQCSVGQPPHEAGSHPRLGVRFAPAPPACSSRSPRLRPVQPRVPATDPQTRPTPCGQQYGTTPTPQPLACAEAGLDSRTPLPPPPLRPVNILKIRTSSVPFPRRSCGHAQALRLSIRLVASRLLSEWRRLLQPLIQSHTVCH